MKISEMIKGQTLRQASESLFYHVVKKMDVLKAKSHIGKEDKQTENLFREVATHFIKRFTLEEGESYALAKLLQVVENYEKWSPEMTRNTVFKAADLLKIKLPSGHF